MMRRLLMLFALAAIASFLVVGVGSQDPLAQAYLDSDGDGFYDPVPADQEDACPDEPGVAPDGCPAPPPDPDPDGDDVPTGEDNCPDDWNAGQFDQDGDGLGNPCDSDRDGDGLQRESDPDDTNADIDGDGVLDGEDNCLLDANSGQADLDGDGEGDACDSDIDGDGRANENDYDPRDPNVQDPPQGEYPTPDTTSQSFNQGWTPAAGSTHLNPRVDCGGSGENLSGTGQNVSRADVTIVNPDARNCARGVEVIGDGFRLISDPNAPGYDPSGMIVHNNTGILFDQGASDGHVYSLGDLAGGELFMKNNYRPITIQSGHDLTIEDTDITHPANLGWPRGPKAIVGIKAIGYLTDFDPQDKSLRNITITDNDVSGVEEEGISCDPNGNHNADSMVAGEGTAGAVSAANDTVAINGMTAALDATYDNAYLVFNGGGAKGRHLKITGVNAASDVVTVADPDNYLADASSGNAVTIGGPFIGFNITNNRVDAAGAYVGLSWGAFVFESEMRDNVIVGQTTRNYQERFNLRPGAGQAIRHSSLTDMPGGPLSGNGQTGISAYNSVTGNVASESSDMDMSWHHRGSGTLGGVPTYRADNVTTGEIYETPGDYTFLGSDPN